MANSDKDIKITPNTGSANLPKIEVTGADNATKTISVADSGALSFDGDLTVSNLTVSGSTTTVNTETVTIDDNILVLNNNQSGTPSENAGLEIERGSSTNVLFRWNESTDRWEFTNDGSTYYNIPISSEYATGDITGVTAGTGLSGGGSSGAVTLNVSGLTISEFAGASITTSGESFADNDTTLMTSAAINDRIESFGYTTNTGDITGVTAGTGLSGGGSSGSVTLNVSGLTISELAAASLTTSAETFADNDTTLMTSAAINDRIESFGYTTNTGDITGVDLTVTSPITISSETNTESGSYSATLGLDDPANLSQLTESSDATTDKILLWDEDASSWKYMTLDDLQDSIDTTGAGANDTTITLSAGTGLSGGGDFTTNQSSIETITFNVSGLTVTELADAAIQTSSESFADSDAALMTAAAINDRIESFGYTTNTGDITGVTAGTGLSGGGNSGAVTLNVSGITISEIAAGSILTSSESFADSDTQVMTAAAIADKIESYGYSTTSGDITGVTAGTGLSGGGSSGSVTLNVSGITVSEIAAGSILIAGETFADNDTSLMSAAAINDRIESFGYTTNTGDITGVTAGTGLSGGGSSGGVTLAVDLSELTDMTATMAGSDEFIVLDGGEDRRKAASEIGLSIFNNDSGFTTNTGDITGVTAGTGLSGGGSSGGVTLNVSGLTVSEIAAGSILVAGETFADNDTSLMTAAAINDRIESFGYTTNTGDITGVTAGTGLSGGGSSGGVTLNVDLKDEDDMTSNSATHAASQQSIKAYVDAEVSGLVDSAPSALNTLNELAAALGDDASYSTTISTALGNRVRVDTASQGLTSTQKSNARTNIGVDAAGTDNSTNVTLVTSSHDYLSISSQAITLGQIDISDDTNLAAGTGISLSGDTLNVGGLTVSELAAGSIQLSSESFADNDTSLMTSAAINDRIESFAYTTNTGDITGVTAGTGLSGGGSSGSVTLNVSGLTVSEIAAGSILIAGETFADNDTSLMTAAAINDRIESFGYTTNTGDITGVTAGTGLSGGGSSGGVTLNVSGITVSEIAAGSIQLSSESFSNDDTSIMTSAAIEDKILSYSYTTNTGDITGVTAGTGMTGGGSSGSVTLTLDLKDEDDMSSDSASHAASQQSIKAYVDAQSGGASAIGSLDDVLMDATNFADGILIQTNSDGSAPSTGTLSTATENIGIGKDVFAALTGGDYNIALGSRALNDLTTGGSNVVVGSFALEKVTTQSGNVAIGTSAGRYITNGPNNTFIGNNAGRGNTSGVAASYNVGIGDGALYAINGVANNNVGIGQYALRDGLTSGDDNIAIGTSAGRNVSTASDLVFIGNEAGYANTTGERNIAIGYKAYDAADTESDNIAIGYDALGGAIDGGEKNIAIGNYSLDAALTGDFNTAVGYGTGTVMTSGQRNSLFGYDTGKAITTGISNTILGYECGIGVSEGNYNVMIGNNAGTNVTSGDGKIVIGNDDGMTGATTGRELAIANFDGIGRTKWIHGTSAGAITFNDAFTFPAADGSANQYLKTDGSGTLTWATLSSGGASAIGGLDDVMMDATNFVDGILIQTNSDGSAPTTGTLSSATENIGIGKDVLKALTSADYNVVIGPDAGESITSGGYNTLIGRETGQYITTTTNTVAIGDNAGRFNTGGNNTFIGVNAGKRGTTGATTNNTMIGNSAGGNNTGGNNTVVGHQALAYGAGGAENVVMGYLAAQDITGDGNVAIGKDAAKEATSVSNSVIMGYEAVSTGILTGARNVAIGYQTMKNATSGADNTFVGAEVVGNGVLTGSNNVGMGRGVLKDAAGADGNVALGYNSMAELTTGDNNTAIGTESMDTGVVTGAKNIALGWRSGNNLTSGSNNVVIGAVDVTADADNQLSISSGDGGLSWITGDANGLVAHKISVVAVTTSTTLTDAQSGSYVYCTSSGAPTLPATAEVGQQYTIINNTGSDLTPGLGSSNSTVPSSHTAISNESARTYVAVAANTWFIVG